MKKEFCGFSERVFVCFQAGRLLAFGGLVIRSAFRPVHSGARWAVLGVPLWWGFLLPPRFRFDLAVLGPVGWKTSISCV